MQKENTIKKKSNFIIKKKPSIENRKILKTIKNLPILKSNRSSNKIQIKWNSNKFDFIKPIKFKGKVSNKTNENEFIKNHLKFLSIKNK